MHLEKKLYLVHIQRLLDMKFTFTSSSLRYYAKPHTQLGNNFFFFIYSSPHRALHLSSWALMFFHSDSAVHLLLFSRLSLFWQGPKCHIRLHYTEHLTSKHFQEIFQDCQVLSGESSHRVIQHCDGSYQWPFYAKTIHIFIHIAILMFLLKGSAVEGGNSHYPWVLNGKK